MIHPRPCIRSMDADEEEEDRWRKPVTNGTEAELCMDRITAGISSSSMTINTDHNTGM